MACIWESDSGLSAAMMTVSESDALLRHATERHDWFRMDCFRDRRRQILLLLAEECEEQIGHGETNERRIGLLAADVVKSDRRLVPDWLNVDRFDDLATDVAKFLLEHPHAAADFSKGQMT